MRKNELECGERDVKEMRSQNEAKLQELNRRDAKLSAIEEKTEQKLKEVVAEAQNRLQAVEADKRNLEGSQAEFRY